jgi:alpha-1,6-mannosyltransferase
MATTTDPAPDLETTLGADTTETEDDSSTGAARAGQWSSFPYRTIALGFFGSLVILISAVGAGGILIHDPVLGNGPLSWIRYGHGKILATVALYSGFGLVVWAWVKLGRHVLAGRVGSRAVVFAAVSWTLPLLFSPPVFTRDVFSYLGQGTLPLHGFDPYQVGPVVLDIPAVSQNVHEFWQTTPAPYGPLFILIAKGVASVAGTNMIFGVILMRLALAVGLGALLWALPGLVRHLGGRLPVALWLALASPMTVVHLFGGPHNDMLMVGFLAAGTLLVLERKHVFGVVLVTLAMAIKATAAIALPFLVWVWARHLSSTFWRNFTRALCSALAVFGLTFTATTLAARVDLGWFAALRAPSMIVNWLSPPTGIAELVHTLVGWIFDAPAQPFVLVFRVIGGLLLATVLVRQWWLSRDGGGDAVRRMSMVLLLTAVLAPATLPWYLTWGFVIAAALPWSPRRLPFVVGTAVFLVLTYSPAGEDLLYNWPFMICALAVSILAGKSLLRPDPLNVFGKRVDQFVTVPATTESAKPVTVSATPSEVDSPEAPERARS